MFTIEHDFDASVITLIDDGEAPLREDVTITAFDDQVVVEQLDPRTDKVLGKVDGYDPDPDRFATFLHDGIREYYPDGVQRK